MERINNTGILKVIGATRVHILKNVIVESFLFFFTSVLIAFFLVTGITSIVQNYTGITFSMNLIFNSGFVGILLISTLILSLLFSIIPGLKISSSKVIDNLKNKTDSRSNGSYLRHGLITAQFVISIVLISFTLLIYKQISYSSNNLVFNQKNTIGIKLTKQLKKDVLKNEFSNNPLINNISFTQFYPGKELSSWATKLQLKGEEQEVHFHTFNADEGFFDIMGLELLDGNFYSDNLSQDKDKVVVNESFLKRFNIENPIGGTFTMRHGTHFEIVGVIKDFHFKSYENSIGPLAIINNEYASYCLANFQVSDFGSLHTTMQEIKKTTAKLSPAFPVEISFLDNAVNKMYESEVRFRRTFSLFAISAIVICAIGILAMSIFASQRRTKEIGVRKVNGARLTEILAMLNIDFIKWVAVAFMIASPISWFVMDKWLNGFAYKTQISWWIFALAGIIALAIALVTVSLQSLRAANRNPVEALRYE
jgi:putative ABC transport system permease protein